MSAPALFQAEQDTLFAMATSCPLVWGNFVQKANAWFSSFDTTNYSFHPCEIPYQEAYARLGERIRENHSQKTVFKVYPNPASTFIRLGEVETLNGKSFIITNLSGVTVHSGNIDSSGMLDITACKNGFYVLSVQVTPGEFERAKFMICR